MRIIFFDDMEEHISRKQKRYLDRREKRDARALARAESVGGINGAFSFSDLYRCGTACCTGVRWKASTQIHESKLYTETARSLRKIYSGTWKPGKYNSFHLTERGKTRPIDAPHIRDRQVHKAFTRNVLLKIYPASMINDNGASLKGKGFKYSMEEFKRQLRRHYRRYGREGYVILLDFERFFPTAPQWAIIRRHERYVINEELCAVGDAIVTAKGDGTGVPLGVEVSQIEMIALPSGLDNFIRCQLHLANSGHYMDDYHILVPKDADVDGIVDAIIERASLDGLTINKSKTRIIPLDKPFRFCKAKYTLSATGGITVRGSQRSFRVARRKIKHFVKELASGATMEKRVHDSVQASVAYFRGYDNHYKALRLCRMYHAMIGGTI